jgi:hypothetical protein
MDVLNKYKNLLTQKAIIKINVIQLATRWHSFKKNLERAT